jgi:small subunit ribosomal protein S17e
LRPPLDSSNQPPPPSLTALQGRVRTKTVKRSARVIVERYYPKLTLDFDTNKRVTGAWRHSRVLLGGFSQRVLVVYLDALVAVAARPVAAQCTAHRAVSPTRIPNSPGAHAHNARTTTLVLRPASSAAAAADEVALVPSKRMRNKIAGFVTHLMRRIDRGGDVRGISLKLQEEERERRMDFVPEKSALQTDTLTVRLAFLFLLASSRLSRLCARGLPARCLWLKLGSGLKRAMPGLPT